MIYRTANNKEVIIWGKELLNELEDNNIKKGDQIKITGYDSVKVPTFDRDGKTIIDWKEAKRNKWCIERAAFI